MTIPIDRESGSASVLAMEAEAAFLRELPQLLEHHSGEWVAYHGDQLIGFAATKSAIYQHCLQLGLDEDGFEVRYVEHQVEEMIIGPGDLR